MKNLLALVALLSLLPFAAGCATAPAAQTDRSSIRPAIPAPKEQVTLSTLAADTQGVIDLSAQEIHCTGEKSRNEFKMQGLTVQAHTCLEGDLKSVTLKLGDETFLFAITRRDPATGKHKSIAGFGALEKKGLMVPLDLNQAPQLPDWAEPPATPAPSAPDSN